jgi:hypothetical protein
MSVGIPGDLGRVAGLLFSCVVNVFSHANRGTQKWKRKNEWTRTHFLLCLQVRNWTFFPFCKEGVYSLLLIPGSWSLVAGFCILWLTDSLICRTQLNEPLGMFA